MPFQDAQIDRIRKRVYYTPYEMMSWDDNGTNLILADTTGATLEPISAASTTGIGAPDMSSDAETIGGAVRVPYDLDPKFDVGFRVCYTVDANGASVITWKLLEDSIAEGGVINQATTVLDTLIAADTFGSVDHLLAWTSRGIRDDIGMTRAQIENGAFSLVNIEMDTGTNLTAVYFLGYEMDYVVQECQGIGSENDRPLTSS